MKQFLFTAMMLCAAGISCTDKHYTDPLLPEESLARFSLDKDFKIEIFAAEPYVADPVELIFDESGIAFVVEMPDYPYKNPNGTGTGRIRMLSDTNSDGRIDGSTIFADSLLQASSILPWKDGLIVTAAPHIFYMKDTNHDNKADTKERLFTGFFNNNPEYQVNNLRFSIDNWIYAANFGQEGKITSGTRQAGALSITTGDFRFRMDNGQFEAETGSAQFGHTLDLWGRRFISENSIHIQQSVIPWRYTHRHPWLPSYETAVNISDHDQLMFQDTEAPYWRKERTKQRNENYRAQKINRTEYADDHFTGACGTTVYAGNAFPEEYYGNIFTNDVAGSLVHRDVIHSIADSVLLIAKRADNEKNREFLSSTDPWFRPSNLTVGPDGALYVVDMYRQHIEAPDFIPEELKKGMNFLNGNQCGRIYRITAKNARPLQEKYPDLKNPTVEELVELLSHPNQWWRLQAQKKFLELQDKQAAPELKNLFLHHADPVVRLHALFALDGMRSLDGGIVKQAMTDPHPGVRESAMMFSEKFPENLPILMEGINDTIARVALQAVLSLGEFSANRIVPALSKVIMTRGEDKWFKIAVLSSAAGSSLSLLQTLIKQGYFSDRSKKHAASFMKDFCFVVGKANREKEIVTLLEMLNAGNIKKLKSMQAEGLTGLADGIKKSANKIKADPQTVVALDNFKDDADERIQSVITELFKIIS